MKSKDNLLSSKDNKAIAIWNIQCSLQEANQARWIEKLKAQGIKAAHPDDGWVNRTENTVLFAYPQFNLNPQIGDRIALGWESEPWRIVEVTKLEHRGRCSERIYYHFKEIKQ